MRRIEVTVTILVTFVVSICAARQAEAREGIATGSLHVGGEQRALAHVYFDPDFLGSRLLVIGTAPADAETVWELSKRGDAALWILLDAATGKAELPGRVIHPTFPGSQGGWLDADSIGVELTTLDGTRAVGRLRMSPADVEGLAQVSFDVEVDATFVEVDPCAELEPVQVHRAGSDAAQAFEKFYAALATCDWTTLESLLTGELLASWTRSARDEEALGILAEIAANLPREATVTSVQVAGDSADLSVRLGSVEAQTVRMTAERDSGGRWKLAASEDIRLDP